MAEKYGNWKVEMEKRLKRIHPQDMPMQERMILHLDSETILRLANSGEDNEISMDLIHNEFRCYSGELTIKNDGTFVSRHNWSEKYIFPVKIWEDTKEVMKAIFKSASLEIVEYNGKFKSGAASTSPHHAYGEKMIEGKYKIKN